MASEIHEQMRPRRSVLYMPAANERALEKAKGIDADALIFDLEDAVAPDAKISARENAAFAVRSEAYGFRELTIRCNSLDTPWGAEDIAAASAAGPAALVIPKVNSAAELDQIAALMDAAKAPSSTSIWAMVETPRAILDIRDIAGHPRVSVMIMGTNDLAREMRAPLVPGRFNLAYPLMTALFAARDAGKVILDGVYNDIKDSEGFVAECKQGVEYGFDGKTLIHPAQVPFANEVWSPSVGEIAHAKKVIEAFRDAESLGKGVATVDGRMIENLHVENAKRTLAVSESLEQRSTS